MLQLKNSSAAFVAFILRALAEDLELFREHDFSVFVEGGKLTLEIGGEGGVELLNCKNQSFISDFPKISISEL